MHRRPLCKMRGCWRAAIVPPRRGRGPAKVIKFHDLCPQHWRAILNALRAWLQGPKPKRVR